MKFIIDIPEKDVQGCYNCPFNYDCVACVAPNGPDYVDICDYLGNSYITTRPEGCPLVPVVPDQEEMDRNWPETSGRTEDVIRQLIARLGVAADFHFARKYVDCIVEEYAGKLTTLGRGTCKVDVLNTGDCAGYECSEYIMHCNACGHEFGHVLYNEDGDVWMSERPNFCPNCGCEVARNEQ